MPQTPTKQCAAVAASTHEVCQHPAKRGTPWCPQHQDPATRAPGLPDMPSNGSGADLVLGDSADTAPGGKRPPSSVLPGGAPVLPSDDRQMPAMNKPEKVTARHLPTGMTSRENHIFAMGALLCADVTPVLWGEPGIGKTAGVRQYAEMLDADLTELSGSNLAEEDFTGIPFANFDTGDQQRSVPSWLSALARKAELEENGEPVRQQIVFLDELSNLSDSAEAAVNALINRSYQNLPGGHKMPSNLMVIAAANRAEQSVLAKRTGQTTNTRVGHLELTDLGSDEWARIEGLVPAGWNNAGTGVFESPEGWHGMFAPDDSAAYQDARSKWGEIIKAFSDSPQSIPSDEAKRAESWPNSRTKSRLLHVLAKIDHVHNADQSRRVVIRSLFGKDVGKAFWIFSQNMDLPNPEDWLSDPTQAHLFRDQKTKVFDQETGMQAEKNGKPQFEHKNRPDKLHAAVSMVCRAAMDKEPPEGLSAAKAKKWKSDRLFKALHVLCQLGEQAVEQGASRPPAALVPFAKQTINVLKESSYHRDSPVFLQTFGRLTDLYGDMIADYAAVRNETLRDET